MFTIQKSIFIIHMDIAAMGLVSSAHLLLTRVMTVDHLLCVFLIILKAT